MGIPTGDQSSGTEGSGMAEIKKVRPAT